VQQPSNVSSRPKRRAMQTQTCASTGSDAAMTARQRRSKARAAKHVPKHLMQEHNPGNANGSMEPPETGSESVPSAAATNSTQLPLLPQPQRLPPALPHAPPLPTLEPSGEPLDVQMADGHSEAPSSPPRSGMAWQQVTLREASETLAARATGFASRGVSPYDRRPTEPWPWRAKGKGKGRGRGEEGGGGRGGARPSPR
jgi:hypothetical protein